MVATDIWIEARLIRALPFFRVLLLDNANGLPLQYELFGRAVRARLSRDFAASAATAILSRGTISFVEDDVFDAGSKAQLGRFDAIRAANILNLAYFSEAKLRAALDNLVGMLKGPGSFLILCRTHDDGSNHGAMFRLNENGTLDAVLRVGDGSELEALVATQGSSSA